MAKYKYKYKPKYRLAQTLYSPAGQGQVTRIKEKLISEKDPETGDLEDRQSYIYYLDLITGSEGIFFEEQLTDIPRNKKC